MSTHRDITPCPPLTVQDASHVLAHLMYHSHEVDVVTISTDQVLRGYVAQCQQTRLGPSNPAPKSVLKTVMLTTPQLLKKMMCFFVSVYNNLQDI